MLVTTGIDGDGIDVSSIDLIIYLASQSCSINPSQAVNEAGALDERRIILMLTEGVEEKRYSDFFYQGGRLWSG